MSKPDQKNTLTIKTRNIFLTAFAKVVVSAGLLTLLAACGKSNKNAETQTIVSQKFSADYTARSNDILVVVEDSGRLDGGPFKERIGLAAKTFAARLSFADFNFHLAFIGSGLRQKYKEGTTVVLPRKEFSALPDQPHRLSSDTPNLRALVEARFLMPRPTIAPPNNHYSHQPLSALKASLDLAAQPGNTNSEFIRKDAFLSILYLTFSDETEEQMLPEDMVKYLDTLKGPGNWSISAVSPDAQGCDINDDGWRTNDKEDVRRNLILRLQDKSQGLFHSICDSNYFRTFEDFLVSGTHNAFFPVQLENLALWETIKVYANDKLITGWKYQPGQRIVELPRFVKSGSNIRISYEIDDGTKTNEVKPKKSEVPQLKERKLSPQELAFNADINPVLGRNCAGCHSAGGPQTQYTDKFANVVANKQSIIERITKPAGDASRMPKDGNMSQTDQDKVVKWLKSL